MALPTPVTRMLSNILDEVFRPVGRLLIRYARDPSANARLELPTNDQLRLSIASKLLTSLSYKRIYRSILFPCVPGSVKASEELHQQLM